MRLLLYILFAVFSPLISSGQENKVTYFNTLFDINGWDGFTQVIETPYGNFIALGGVNPDLSHPRLGVVKVNLEGKLICKNTYGDNLHQYYMGLYGKSLVQTYDGNYAFGGSLGSEHDLDTYGLLCKFNEDGDTLWTRRFQGPDSTGYFNACRQTPDSGYILLGVSQKYVPTSNADVWLLKTDKVGNFEWEQTFESGFNDGGLSIELTKKSGFLLGCGTNSANSSWIIKTDSLGNKEWEKKLPNDFGSSCILSKDGGYVLYASTYINGNNLQAWMLKLSHDGDSVLWEKTYGGNDLDWFNAAYELEDGNIVAVGVNKSTDENPGNQNGWLMKLSPEGNMLWEKFFRTDTSLSNHFWAIQPTTDKGFIIAGSAWRNNTQDGWLVKTDSLGNSCQAFNELNEYVGCDSCVGPGCVTGIEPTNHAINSPVSIYPNPFSTYAMVTLAMTPYSIAAYKFELYDLTGSMLQQKAHIHQPRFYIQRGELPAGMYFYKVLRGNELIGSGKVAVQ